MSAIHNQLGAVSFNSLPQWEQDLWESQRNLIPEYCAMPDDHLVVQNDFEQEEKLSPYCVLPDGKAIPHGPCDDNYTLCIFSNNHSRRARHEVIHYYLGKVISLMRNQELEEAAKFGGVLAHYLQDGCSPGHVINNLLLNKLYPPQSGQTFHYHRIMDSWSFEPPLTNISPKLFGGTLDEAVFNLCSEYDKSVSFALSKVCPFVEAIQKVDKKQANKISNELNAKAILLTVSTWHTAFCIAYEKFERQEVVNLNTINLGDRIPIEEFGEKYSREELLKYGIKFHETKYVEADPWRSKMSNDPYPFEPIDGMATDGKGKTFPLILSRQTKDIEFEKGFASGGASMLVFEAPGKLYKEFRVSAGIHPISPDDSKASFAVLRGQKENPFVANVKCSKENPSHEFIVPLDEDCKTITLIVTEGNPGVHAIWANPRLIKRFSRK